MPDRHTAQPEFVDEKCDAAVIRREDPGDSDLAFAGHADFAVGENISPHGMGLGMSPKFFGFLAILAGRFWLCPASFGVSRLSGRVSPRRWAGQAEIGTIFLFPHFE